MVLIFSVPSAVSTSHVRINREALKTVRDELGSLFVWTPICAAATELICALPRYPSMYDKHHDSDEQLKLRKAKSVWLDLKPSNTCWNSTSIPTSHMPTQLLKRGNC
jgi:hypothetical protein